MSRPTRKPTLWTLRKVSTRISLSLPRRLIPVDTFRLLWIFCFRNHCIIPISPETECVGPDQSARTAQADLDRYITERPYSYHYYFLKQWCSGTASVFRLKCSGFESRDDRVLLLRIYQAKRCDYC